MPSLAILDTNLRDNKENSTIIKDNNEKSKEKTLKKEGEKG